MTTARAGLGVVAVGVIAFLVATSAGKTIATWGEGTSYDGPGGVWVNRQP